MKLPIINAEDSSHGFDILSKYYQEDLIPAEKKTYITNLRESIGPYLGIEAKDGSTHYLLDAASQIATLGHGFNPSVFFGSSHFLESWLNDSTTKEFKKMRISFQNFLIRKLNWPKAYLTFVHSGAEANEVALGYCYISRVNKEANKVLAFEGSFHGRMMVTLAATWNKSKREPFEWKNYLAEYVKYPDQEDGSLRLPFPEDWRLTWNNASLKEFSIPENWTKDKSLEKEINSLLNVRSQLLTKKIFAILIEPMQCEGGDCYSSDRFHTALLIMSKTFQVPVIYDEVQTGFHLGKEFFWHKEFVLRGLNNEQINPDYVVTAKKAQIGIVISHKETKNIFKGEEFSVASTFRGYSHAISLDQAQPKIIRLENEARSHLIKLINKFDQFILNPRNNGMAFAFDLKDPALLNKFIDSRFNHGLLFYPAGNRTLRFRLNTAFTQNDFAFLFEQLDLLCSNIFLKNEVSLPKEVDTNELCPTDNYIWHEFLVNIKLNKALGNKPNHQDIFSEIQKLVTRNTNLNLIEINKGNFSFYRKAIIELQKIVYEPARQTDIEKFEKTIHNIHSLCLGVVDNDNKLVGIAFAGPLKLYPLERGVRNDPYFNDEDSLYMLDLTMSPLFQGTGLGKSLKYALSALATLKGVKRIQGRNRDRLASAMININLSLGAVEQVYIKEDYPDFESYRDVFYYTTQTEWKKPHIHLSRATTIPLSLSSLSPIYIKNQLPFIVNKVCLSNFVSEIFLENIRSVTSYLPLDLRHVYTCSGQSECTDKVIKSVWVKSKAEIKEKSITKLMTFKNHFFGNGSMLSRSLSYDSDQYFDVVKLQSPNENNYLEILKQIDIEFTKNKYLALLIEPVLQKTMEKMPYEFLRGIRDLTKKYDVALIFNETASQFYRFSFKNFFASSFTDISPDAGIIYCSGQCGLTFVSSKYFLDQPLMLISTWDGDEFSFNSYYQAFSNVITNSEQYKTTAKDFHQKIIDDLSKFEIDIIKIENGFGYFKGAIPNSMSKMFVRNGDHYLVCPSFDSMKEYLEQ